MRTCRVCGQSKSEEEFVYRQDRGYRPYCKICGIEGLKKYDKPWDGKLHSYKRRDRKKGFICDLTNDWYYMHIYGEPCYYCGAVDDIGCDRLDNTKGHTKENVVPCCVRCNTIRSNFFSPEQMKKIASFIKIL